MLTDFMIEKNVLKQYKGSDAVVKVPEGITEIGKGAFEKNKNLTEVILPAGVVRVGSCAFRGCTKLKTVRFPAGLEEIGYEAFWGCGALKELALPDTLRTLGGGTFAGCVKLAILTCDSKVFEPGANPFSSYDSAHCAALADADGFLIFCGVLYAWFGNAADIVVPEGVREIADRVFESGSSGSYPNTVDLKSVILPDSVKRIGSRAFADNKKLKSIRLPQDVILDDDVFSGCCGLADENGYFIHNDAALVWFGDGKTSAVPEGVKTLGSGLFRNSKLRSVSLPAGLQTIGSAAFANTPLESIDIPDSVVSVGNSAFANCTGLTRVVIPESVREIGNKAFYGCVRLRDIRLPSSVEVLGDGAFTGCTGLADENGFVIVNGVVYGFSGAQREIALPKGITAVEDGAFNKSGVISVRLPSTLQRLGAAFTECNCLTEMEIPEGIETLAERTFAGCTALARVTLPQSLTGIGHAAFRNCQALKALNIPAGVKTIGSSAFEGCASLEEIIIPEGVSVIGSSVFYRCSSLRRVDLPKGLRRIERIAFQACTSLEEITLPDALEEIESSAFSCCKALRRVNCARYPQTINDNAFSDCDSLGDENGFVIIADVLLKCKKAAEHVTVPEGIRVIGEDVFREGWKNMGRGGEYFKQEGILKSVVLPSSLQQIHPGAFAGCEALEEILLPEGLQEIGAEAFSDCAALKEILVPDGVRSLGEGAFRGCGSLTAIHLPAAATLLPPELLKDCVSLRSVMIPGTAREIGKDLFSGCSSLTDIQVESVSQCFSAADGFLYNRSRDTLLYVAGGLNLREYSVPSHIKTIGPRAFSDCVTMKKIVIPANVENVGDEAFPRTSFMRGSSLTEIEVSPGAGKGSIGESIFDFGWEGNPLVYPKLPVTFVKKQSTQTMLGLGYCLNPERYEGEYAELYREYAASHQKSIMKKARRDDLPKLEAYFSPEGSKPGGYRPDLSLKKPNELRKVLLLEEAVMKGTPADVEAVMKTYAPFELTARALGLAARYRGLAYVRALAEHGASFRFSDDSALIGKYSVWQKTVSGAYRTEYYLMVVPDTLNLSMDWSSQDWISYDYTPLCGVKRIGLPSQTEENALPLSERIEIAKFFAAHPKLGVSLDEMLMCALLQGAIAFADALIGMGADLGRTPPSFYKGGYGRNEKIAYLDIISSRERSVYRTYFINEMKNVPADLLLPVLERLHTLADAAGKKLFFTQAMFDELPWTDPALAFTLSHVAYDGVNQRKMLEKAVAENAVSTLAVLAVAGWISQPAKRDALITLATEKNCTEALAWLLDYKNRTADFAAEAAAEEKKLMRELTIDPNSATALKKNWSDKKREDGTLIITSYKGSDTAVTIPAVIGKQKVTAIGENALSATWWLPYKNLTIRKQITEITIPEGIEIIEERAFADCKSLETVHLPESLSSIGPAAFGGCEKLKSVSLPKRVRTVAKDAFLGCPSLQDENGFAVIGEMLVGYYGKEKTLHIPKNVTLILTLRNSLNSSGSIVVKEDVTEVILPDGLREIGKEAFAWFSGLTSVRIPASVRSIGKEAFRSCGLQQIELSEGLQKIGEAAFKNTRLKTVKLPHSLRSIGKEAFYDCTELREIWIPAETEKIGENILGEYDTSQWGQKPAGIYVHTPAGSAAALYMQRYGGVIVVNDGSEPDGGENK